MFFLRSEHLLVVRWSHCKITVIRGVDGLTLGTAANPYSLSVYFVFRSRLFFFSHILSFWCLIARPEILERRQRCCLRMIHDSFVIDSPF